MRFLGFQITNTNQHFQKKIVLHLYNLLIKIPLNLHLNNLMLHFACFEFTFILCEFILNTKFLTRHKIDFKLDGKCFAVLHYIKF